FSHAQLEPLSTLQPVEHLVGDLGALLQASTAFNDSAHQCGTQAFEGRALDNAELFIEVLADLVELHLFDGQGTGVALHAVTGEDLYVNDRTLGASRHTQGRVLHIRGLLTEDRTQQLLFRRQLSFTLRGDLADQNVACAHFSTDIHDARFV